MAAGKRLARAGMAALVVGIALCAASASALADWRKEIGTFRVGAPASALRAGVDATLVRDAFAAALGMPVEVVILPDYTKLIEAQAGGRVEYIMHTASSFATVDLLCECVEPLAAPYDVDGATGQRSILIVRRGIAGSAAEISKLRVATSPPDSFSGWQAPLALLQREGVSIGGDEAFLVKATSQDEAELFFAEDKADAIFGWERVEAGGEAPLPGGTIANLGRRGVGIDQLHIVWRSGDMPFGPHAVIKTLDPEAKRLLREFLIGLQEKNVRVFDLLSGGHSGGMKTIAAADYELVRQVMRATAARKAQ